jgi:starvation-inducible DNA-binding protein
VDDLPQEDIAMSTVRSTLDDRARDLTGAALQETLTDLLDLSLLAKQAHWNVTGPLFRELHLQLDEVVTLARDHADAVAERAAAIGVHPDGRAQRVAADRVLPDPGTGELADKVVIDAFADILRDVATRLRARIEVTGETDKITEDLLIGITAEVEKQAWMFQAHRG